jgi:hypothetical protein
MLYVVQNIEIVIESIVPACVRMTPEGKCPSSGKQWLQLFHHELLRVINSEGWDKRQIHGVNPPHMIIRFHLGGGIAYQLV